MGGACGVIFVLRVVALARNRLNFGVRRGFVLRGRNVTAGQRYGYWVGVARELVCTGRRDISSPLSESQFGGGRLFYVRCAEVGSEKVSGLFRLYVVSPD